MTLKEVNAARHLFNILQDCRNLRAVYTVYPCFARARQAPGHPFPQHLSASASPPKEPIQLISAIEQRLHGICPQCSAPPRLLQVVSKLLAVYSPSPVRTLTANGGRPLAPSPLPVLSRLETSHAGDHFCCSTMTTLLTRLSHGLQT